MLIAPNTYFGFLRPQFNNSMRTRFMRLTFHFLVGVVLGVFLLPEGAAVVLATAAAAAGAKAFYDYLKRGVDLIAGACLVAGALAVLLATA